MTVSSRAITAAMAAVAFATALGAAACASPSASGFSWKGADGSSLAFRQTASWESGTEGRFGPGRLENAYRLENPYSVAAGRCLEVSVASAARTGGEPVALRLDAFSSKDRSAPLLSASFPLLDSFSRFALTLPSGSEVASLRVVLEGTGAAASSPSIMAEIVAITDLPAFRGYSRGKEGARVSSGFSFSTRAGESLLSIDAPFDDRGRLGLVLTYGATQAGDRIRVSGLGPGETSSSFTLIPRAAGGRLVLGKEAFVEGTLSVEARLPARIGIEAFRVEELSDSEYEVADLGRVLGSRPRIPGADYDLYRWELLPSVLVLDFADYAVQDRYLKRLAFFVEKAGYRGTLQRDEVIAPLHGWNAHDYRPEDLAAFYRAAKTKGFPLNGEERALERLLVERGVLREKAGKIEPGTGALISITRESSAYLRRTFIVHESTHALFFADPEYRSFVAAAWKAIDPEEKWFWKRYFQWMVYDTTSEYLMANEYQAYLLQQPLTKTTEYFTKNLPANLLAPEVLERDPELKVKVDEYMEEFGERFHERAVELESWLGEKYGIAAGRTYFLY